LDYEHISQLLIDSNFSILVLKILSTWFTSPGEKGGSTGIHSVPEPTGLDIFEYCQKLNKLKVNLPMTRYNDANVKTSANLLHILYKITKQKNSRILFLIQWKAPAVLKKVIRLNVPVLNLYSLKLFKIQIPFLGRKWKTCIYK
jgi:hypothetical protein